MEDSITIRHGLSCFSVTSEPELVTTKTGKEVYVTRGISTAPGPGSCPRCGNAMHRHGKMEMKVQDIDLLGHLHIISSHMTGTGAPAGAAAIRRCRR